MDNAKQDLKKKMKTANFALAVTTIIFAIVCPAKAQQTDKVLPRIGVIVSTGAPGTSSPWFDSFMLGLKDLGYVENKNILIQRRYAEGRLDKIPELVKELVQERVDVILAPNNVAIQAAKKATTAIPIVIVSSVDPVEAGYVASFARPGGNITGLANLGRDLSAKRVELLKELLPKMTRIGIIWDADGPGPKIAFKEYEEAAQGFKLELRSVPVHGPNPDIDKAFHMAKAARAEALIVVRNPLISRHAKQIFDLATKARLPSISEEGQFVEAGGLLSYGASATDFYRRAAEYAVEIIRGAKPADLPIKLASKFDIFVNLKTAQQIGMVIPQRLLVQADKVIK